MSNGDQGVGQLTADTSAPAEQVSSAIPGNQLTPEQVWEWLSTHQAPWRIAMYLLLFAPLLLSGPLPGIDAPVSLVWPRVHSGDEPHYLVILNSIIEDGDLDLSNNYASVHAGNPVAGRSFAGMPLDHHVSWYENGKIVYWWMVFETDPRRWQRDTAGVPIPTRQPGKLDAFVPSHEYPTHPPGVGFLLAIPALLFRKTAAVESVALFCTALVVVLASLFFEKLIAPYTRSWQERLCLTAVTFLCSPLWHYARCFFVEPYLMCLALAAYACALRMNRYGVAGVCVAMGIWMKPPFALLMIPLALVCLFENRIFALAKLTVPVAISAFGIMGSNYVMHGSMLASTIAWESGNPIRGAVALMFSPAHGILMLSPIVVVSLMLLPKYCLAHFRDCLVFGLSFALYFSMMSLFVTWHGGFCFGPRMIIPILPFLYFPLCCIVRTSEEKLPLGRQAIGMLVAVSFLFNLVGAFGCGWVWNHHPAEVVADWLSEPT